MRVRVRLLLALLAVLAIAALAVGLAALLRPAHQVVIHHTVIRHTTIVKHTTIIEQVPGRGPYRHQAGGRASLAWVAGGRHVAPAVIERATLGSPWLSAPNRAAFTAYVHHGVTRPMPRGLVYYTATGPAQG